MFRILNNFVQPLAGLRIAAESPPQPKQPPPPPPPQLKSTRKLSEEDDDAEEEEEDEHEDVEEVGLEKTRAGYRPVEYNNQKHAGNPVTRPNVSRHQAGEYLETPQSQRSANGAVGGGCSEVSPSNSSRNRGETLRGFSGIMGEFPFYKYVR